MTRSGAAAAADDIFARSVVFQCAAVHTCRTAGFANCLQTVLKKQPLLRKGLLLYRTRTQENYFQAS